VIDKLTEAPPIDPGNIRVLLHLEDMEGQPFADLHVAKLPEWFAKLDEFAGYIPTPPLVEGTDQGARSARTMFMRALSEEDGYALGTQVALWICLHAPPYLPGLGLTMDDLRDAADVGTIRIYPKDDFWTWHFDFAGPRSRQGGRKDIPRDPKSLH
jgi:hypothetical protein